MVSVAALASWSFCSFHAGPSSPLVLRELPFLVPRKHPGPGSVFVCLVGSLSQQELLVLCTHKLSHLLPAFLHLILLPLCLVSTLLCPQPKGPPTAPLPRCSSGRSGVSRVHLCSSPTVRCLWEKSYPAGTGITVRLLLLLSDELVSLVGSIGQQEAPWQQQEQGYTTSGWKH